MIMKVIEIVKQYLENNGFDGLVRHEIECGCELSDLQPCDGDFSRCRPAYKHNLDGFDFVMSEHKEPPNIT